MLRKWAVFSLAILLAGAAEAQTRTVKGTVADVSSGDPVAGATVKIAGTAFSVNTAADGNFIFPDAPTGTLTLNVTVAGYRGATAQLPENQSEARISLQRELAEEIVVTGRASTSSRQHVAVSVAKVTGEDLNDVPAQTIDQALQGKVTGANIQRNDGAPGGGAQVRLRGTSSIYASAEPLFVVDGMIVSNAAIPSGIFNVTKSNQGGNHSTAQDSLVNRIADFNPEDIESIEVLKGAAAAAIYGSKASNGVVIITTKRGAAGPPKVDFTQRLGASYLAKEIGARTFTSAADVVSTFCPNLKTTGAPDPACVAQQTAAYGSGTVYNHDSEMAGRHGLAAESVLSVSGGQKDFRYFVSGAVKDDPGIIANTGYQKQALRVNLGKDIGDKWTLNFNSTLIHSDAKRGLTNNDNTNTSHWIVLSGTPSFVNLNPNANGVFPTNPYSPGNLTNPLQTVALMGNNEGLWRFTSSADSTFKLYRDEQQSVRFLINGGIDRFQQENDIYFPPELFFEATSQLPGASGYTSTASLNLNLGFNLVHDWRPSSGLFAATSSAGFQYESSDLRVYRLFSQYLNAGQPNIDAGAQSSISEQRERIHDRGAYLQEEVLLLERKLALTGGLRGESSSTNGDPNAIYFYPKLSASYRFVEPASQLDDIKVRAAYGETGNHPLYAARFTSLQVNQNLQGNPGIGVNFNCSPPAPGNGACAGAANIKPERAREFEIGADVTAFGGAATLEVNLYQRTIVDLLLQHGPPSSSGWTAEWINGGVLRNRGIEVGLTAQPKLGYDVLLTSTLGFSRNVSSIRSLPVPAFVVGGFGASLGVFKIEQGQSATQIVGTVAGVCCTKIGDTEPDFIVHFSNRLSWRGFTLSFLLDWQNGSNIINLTRLLYDANSNSADWNTAGKARFSNWLAGNAAAYVESASFLKLREITLSYDVPSAAVSSVWGAAKRLRLSVSARNLFTISPYSSWDPEVSNFANQPIYRNIEVTPYPSSRSFWTALELGFY
jgi:TonB-linked SusC/RagA family outer membrane protein